MKNLIIPCFIVFITSCIQKSHDPKLLEKEEDLKNFYLQVLKEKPPTDGIVVIVQNQRCSSCRYETFSNFSKLLNSNYSRKIFIMHHLDTALINMISEVESLEIKLDSTHKLQNFGLDYAADLFFLFKNGQLNKWFEISNYNIDSLKYLE